MSNPQLSTLPELDESSHERARRVAALPRGSRVHISGICGTGTAAVASLLKQLGFSVTGSDKAFYPPMGDIARALADQVFEGYSAANLTPAPDLVVIGNSLSRGNPEVEAVLAGGLPYASMPEVFAGLLIGSREQCPTSVVVSGTHGKTTTSALVATMFESAGWRPGFFVGGVARNFSTTIRPVDLSQPLHRRVVVLEGDEYDSAFFAKWPKFHSYRPDLLVITSIEFDHADIYESLEQIETEFKRLVARVPRGGTIFVCADQPRLAALFPAGMTAAGATVEHYGTADGLHFRLVSREPESGGQRLALSLRGAELQLRTAVSGPHNALNMLATAAVGHTKGLSLEEIRSGLEAFAGVARRQSVVAQGQGITVIEDFAHHPTAITVTLRGLREVFPGRRILAVYEPRSNTSRRSFFQGQYRESFSDADLIVIQEMGELAVYSNTSAAVVALDVPKLVKELQLTGKQAACFRTIDEIATYLEANTRQGDVIVVMSNGDFGGLLPRLTAWVNGD